MAPKYNKGAFGELHVAAQLTRAGFSISLPFNHTSPYDVIVDKGGHVSKCQVKTSSRKKSKNFVEFGFTSKSKRVLYNQKGNRVLFYKRMAYSPNDIDCFLLCDATSANIFVVPFCSKRTLRFEYDSDNIADYIRLNKTWATPYLNNWEFIGAAIEETERINKEYGLDVYGYNVKLCKKEIKKMWGKYLKAPWFAKTFGVSNSFAKRFLEKRLKLCYSQKYGGYNTNIFLDRSIAYYGRAIKKIGRDRKLLREIYGPNNLH